MSTLMKWKDRYAVGVPEIDAQHREIFRRTNKLIELRKGEVSRDRQYQEVGKVLNFLIDYVKSHFKSEEAIQRKYDYPDYEAHNKIHKTFIIEIEGLREDYQDDNQSITTLIDLSRTLLNWLVRHIVQEDRKIAEHIKSIDK